jgi:carbon monoxide dehydrogenase subunit G
MRMEHHVEIGRSKEDLWPWLTETDRMKQWMKGLLEITPVSEGEPREGFLAKMRIKEGRKVSEYDEEITTWDPPNALAVRLTGGALPEGMEMKSAYRLEAIGGRNTKVTCVTTAEVSGLYKLLSPLMRLFAGAQMKSFFRTLKKLAEAEA